MLRLIEKWRHSDVITVLENSFLSALSKGVAMATVRDSYSNFYFQTISIYFRKSHQIWLSFAELWAKNLEGGAKKIGQDRVKASSRGAIYIIDFS